MDEVWKLGANRGGEKRSLEIQRLLPAADQPAPDGVTPEHGPSAMKLTEVFHQSAAFLSLGAVALPYIQSRA